MSAIPREALHKRTVPRTHPEARIFRAAPGLCVILSLGRDQPRIALTGGPGGGKTTKADLFRRGIGVRVIAKLVSELVSAPVVSSDRTRKDLMGKKASPASLCGGTVAETTDDPLFVVDFTERGQGASR